MPPLGAKIVEERLVVPTNNAPLHGPRAKLIGERVTAMGCLFRHAPQQNQPGMYDLRHTKETEFLRSVLICRNLGG